MNRVVSFIFVIIIGHNIYAQTYYYKYIKSVYKGVENKDVNGGQFITFNGKKCYESDRNGYSVGNGSMSYEDEYSNNQIYVYWGACYYSNNAYFKFNRDSSLLNIETNAGKIFIYEKSTPPSNVTTCSLIRQQDPTHLTSNGNKQQSSSPLLSMQNSQPQVIVVEGNSVGDNQQRQRPQRQEPIKHECPLCHGEKWIVHNSYPPMYGQTNYKVRCDRCGKEFMKSTGHQHIICTQCRGLGYFIVK